MISTPIGKIGVGICAEHYYCFAASEFLEESADFVIMPHASPDMSGGGGLPSPPGTHLASWYVRKLGVPVAMVNKVGRSVQASAERNQRCVSSEQPVPKGEGACDLRTPALTLCRARPFREMRSALASPRSYLWRIIGSMFMRVNSSAPTRLRPPLRGVERTLAEG